MEKRQLARIFIALSLFWTGLIALFIAFIYYQKHNEIKALALLEARTGINKDLAFRTWAADKGGVYAPIDKNTPPNPYLNIPNREVNTTTGLQLTLINPAYALRQINESYGKYSLIKGHLTSLKLLNPYNKPSEWEISALQRIEKTRTDFYEINDNTFQYMRPFFVEQKCLKCHEQQGYKIGDIRGGLSVQIPLKHYEEIFTYGIQTHIAIIIAIWSLGLIGLYWGYRSSYERINEKINLYEQNLYSLVSLIEQRDNYTAGHGRRVGEYSRLIAQQLGLDEKNQEELYRAGALHDIGKVAIPDSILLKPGKLEPIERKLIEEHVNASYELLSKVEIFSSIAEIIRYHHERLDGSGYPFGYSGDQIPLNSQILAIADCFDAMTTNRIYKGRKGVKEALHELQTSCQNQFHPDIIIASVEAFSTLTLEQVSSQHPSTPLEIERFSYFYKDSLTGLYSPGYLNYLFLEPDFKIYTKLHFITLHHMNRLNRQHGWDKGDELLKRYAQMLQSLDSENPIIRFQGDDFIIFKTDSDETNIPNHYTPQWLDEYGINVSCQEFKIEDLNTETIASFQAILTKTAFDHYKK